MEGTNVVTNIGLSHLSTYCLFDWGLKSILDLVICLGY